MCKISFGFCLVYLALLGLFSNQSTLASPLAGQTDRYVTLERQEVNDNNSSTEGQFTNTTNNLGPNEEDLGNFGPLTPKNSDVTKMLNDLLRDYDKRLRPDFLGSPTQVCINVLVKDVASINEKDMEFKLDFYLRQTWRDPRLAFNLSLNGSGQGQGHDHGNGHGHKRRFDEKVKDVTLGSDFIDKIFIPDTFFRNEKTSFIHSTTVPNRFVKLHSDGKVLMSMRLTMTASCKMDLTYFPMDKQVCGLSLGSYIYTIENMEYVWTGCEAEKTKDENEVDRSISVDFNTITLPQFAIAGFRRSHGVIMTSTGNYSALSFDFLFVRSLSYYLVKNYLPATIVVAVAYFGTWFGRDSSYLLAYARMSIGITSVLTITTIYMSSTSNLNNTNYVKALDVYLMICFVGVFTTLFTSVLMLYVSILWKKKEKQVDKEKAEEQKRIEQANIKNQIKDTKLQEQENDLDRDSKCNHCSHGNGETDTEKVDKVQEKEKQKDEIEDDGKAHIRRAQLWLSKIDRACRIAYPILFAVLNLIYWAYYLTASQGNYSDLKWVNLAREPL